MQPPVQLSRSASRTVLLALVAVLSLGGCAKSEFGPIATPAAEHPAYARAYPNEVMGLLSLYDVEKSAAAEFPKKASTFVAVLDDAEWTSVETIYRLAEFDGKSAHYARVQATNSEVATFFVDERKDVVKHVSGGVHYQAKQAGCRANYSGAIDIGLERALQRRFESRQDGQSQALLFIRERGDRLGKKNVDLLRGQSKSIAAHAHLVGSILAERYQDLKRKVEEANQIKATLSARLDEIENSRTSSESEEERTARNEEYSQLFSARVELDNVVAKAKRRLKTMRDEVLEARRSFNATMQLLREQLKEKSGSASAVETAKPTAS